MKPLPNHDLPRNWESLNFTAAFACANMCKPGCIWSPITCETSRISWKVVVIGSRTESNENGHIEVMQFLVTIEKTREKSHKKNKKMTSTIHFSAFFKLNVSEWHMNPGGPTCKAHGWCKDSSHFPPNLCTGTKSLQHRFQHWKHTKTLPNADSFDSFPPSSPSKHIHLGWMFQSSEMLHHCSR